MRSPIWDVLKSQFAFNTNVTMNGVEEHHSDDLITPNDSVTAETSAAAADGAILVEDLLKKCHDLLNELDQFRTFVAENNRQNAVEIRQFQNSILSELKSLEKVYRLHIERQPFKPADHLPALFR